MLRPKYRNIIPNESEEKKNKDKSSYSEVYDVGGLDSKAKLIIKSLYTEKSNFEIHGNFLYQIKNCSHFEIDSELDFSKSSNYRTQEKNAFEPNKTLFKSHIEPFQDLNKSITKEKVKKEEEEDGICKVQYKRGYKIKTLIKLAFTFPSLEKQLLFVKEDHKEIREFMQIWKRFKPSQIEQLLLFNNINYNNAESCNVLNLNTKRNYYNYNNSDYKNSSKYILFDKKYKPSCDILREFIEVNNLNMLINREGNDNRNNNNENNMNQSTEKEKVLSFIDMSFPPCQEDYRIINLNKEIATTKRFSSTEKKHDKTRKIVFHYRPIESLIPEQKQLFNKDDVNCYDIKCGLFKNKNIISVFAHLADYPYFLSKIFIENNIDTIGIYKLKLFYQNFWTDITIDKYIPCFPCYFPLYTYSETSLWPCALEKALAKLYRGYDNLKYISFFELYQILTGFPVINFKKIYKDIPKEKLIEMFEILNNKDNGNLDEMTNDFKFIVNSKYNNDAVEKVNKSDVINNYLFCNNNGYYENNNPINIAYNDYKNGGKNNINYFMNENDDDGVNKINFNNEVYPNNSYMMAFYASNSYLKYLMDIESFPFDKKNLKTISNKVFPAKYANENYVVIKSIYNYQLKKLLSNYFLDENNSFNNNQNDNLGNKMANSSRETETLTLTWDMLLTLFDNVIIIKSNNYQELHFRNGFIRCQDVQSPDYDRILAHSYYELSIKKHKNDKQVTVFKEDINIKIDQQKEKDQKSKKDKNNEENNKKNVIKINSIDVNLDSINYFKNKFNNMANNTHKKDKKELIPVTIVINLSNDHFLDESYYSREMDLKIGIIQLVKKNKSKQKDPNNKKNISDPFYGTSPILVTCPDFQIGYSLVYELFLEEGNYIIVPMTMGYCMQKNEKIKSYYYSLRDKNGHPLQIQKTVIPRFLDDVFYLNDPFGKNYLEYNVINSIAKNILDNKGHKIKNIDENSLYNNFSKITDGIFDIKKEKFGLSKLSFEDFIFDEMTLLTELQKKQCMQNLGYENNTYPYLSRLIGVSFYFGNCDDRDIIKIIPKNNLTDSNIDKFVNIRTLEKNIFLMKNIDFGRPKRIYYPLQGWYTIEGVYMKKNMMGKDEKKMYDFEKEIYKGKNVFFSTNSNNITAMVNSGNIKFLLYTVMDVIRGKNNKKNINNEKNETEEEEKKESEQNDEEDNKSQSKELDKSSSIYSKENNN